MLTNEDNENSFNLINTCYENCLEPVGYYCENCEISGCSHCMIRFHKSHNYLSLSKKVCIINNVNNLTNITLERNNMLLLLCLLE
mgnify:CR=1 FL=1